MHKFAAVLLVVTGCSVALQSKPKAGRVATSECSTTSAYWIADAVGVAAGFSTMVGGVVATSGERSSDAISAAAMIGGMAGLLYLASAHNGRRWASQCRENQETAPVALR